MAANIPAVNISSSPPSGGTRTHHGTPSTIPTIMSPDAANDDLDNAAGIPKLELARQGASSSLATRRNLSVAPVNIPNRLSPTAEDFTPNANTTTFTVNALNARVGGQGRQGYSPVRELLVESNPDSSSPAYSCGGVSLTFAQSNPGIIGTGLSTRPFATQQGRVYRFGRFTVEDEGTRAFAVSGISGPSAGTIYELIAISYRNFSSIVNINAQHLHTGVFSVEFYDHDEAKQALYLTIDFIFRDQPLRCYKLLPQDIARMNGLPTASVSNHVAEYIVSVIDVGTRGILLTGDDILQACKACGKVKAFHTIQALEGAIMSFRVEWSDSRTTVNHLSMALLLGFRITIMPYTPDIARPSASAGITALPSPDSDSDEHTRNVMAFLHPSPPNAVNMGNRQNAVDIMKIMLGQDVRTTIMLRNIPNRVDQAGLKTLLDQTSFGQYDFMYLRIDFANNCNVGYAFINFMDPMAIVPFARARAGKKWNLFQSDKVAEISYATIQGRDCLIQKFRNSSVMLERPAFRPKLYRTGRGPNAGTEEEFPRADNHAKLKRSCDNAEHVGLYLPESPITGNFILANGPSTIPPPRNQRAGGIYTRPAQTRAAIAFNRAAELLRDEVEQGDYSYLSSSPESSSPNSLYAPREGQAYRERQRRHFSRFDRGTPGAESEFATATPFRHVSATNYGNAASASTIRNPGEAITSTSNMGPASFGSQPIRPPGTTVGYNPASYLAQSFQGFNV